MADTKTKILKILLKQFKSRWTVTALSKEINLSRVGTWKALKNLEREKLISLSQIGEGKTNSIIVNLNWENLLLEKKLSLILTEEALKHRRWMENFEDVGKIVDFLILYGSILHSPREASDIDILGVVSSENDFQNIEEALQKIQKIQSKKIHSENFTKKEFEKELKKRNKIFIDAIKKGIVLFGQDEFIKFRKNLKDE